MEHTEEYDYERFIECIETQRFCFGGWRDDLSAVRRGVLHDDSRICEYITKLEALVEHLKKKQYIINMVFFIFFWGIFAVVIFATGLSMLCCNGE